MSIFDRHERSLSRAVDRQFAVRAIIDGMTRTPNGRPQPDPARAEIHVKGILDQRDEMAPVEVGARDGSGNGLRTIASGYDFVFSVDVSRYPAAKDVRQSDRLTLDDGRKFEVVSTRRDGQSRIVFALAEPR